MAYSRVLNWGGRRLGVVFEIEKLQAGTHKRVPAFFNALLEEGGETKEIPLGLRLSFWS